MMPCFMLAYLGCVGIDKMVLFRRSAWVLGSVTYDLLGRPILSKIFHLNPLRKYTMASAEPNGLGVFRCKK